MLLNEVNLMHGMKITGAYFIRWVKMWVKEDGYMAPDHLTSINTVA